MLQDLSDGPFRHSNLDAGASIVISVPAPLGGALVVGEAVIAYINQGHPMKCTPIKPTIVRVCCALRWAYHQEPTELYISVDLHFQARREASGMNCMYTCRTRFHQCPLFLSISILLKYGPQKFAQPSALPCVACAVHPA
jgi:hypothetical protein